jgi:hypothetical protein
MMPRCQAPIPDGTLLDYWARDLAGDDELGKYVLDHSASTRPA